MTPKPDKAGDVVGPEYISWCGGIGAQPTHIRLDLYDKLKQERDDLAVIFGDIARECKKSLDERDRYREVLVQADALIKDGYIDTPLDLIQDFIKSERETLSPREPGGEG